jgi:hypothetical protein
MPFYRSPAWLSWMVNLLLAELWLRRGERSPRQLVAAGPQGVDGAGTRSHTSNSRE